MTIVINSFKKICICLFYICISFTKPIVAQDISGVKLNKIDSTLSLIKTSVNDSVKAKLYIEVAKIYTNSIPDSALYYANQSLSISYKNKYLNNIETCLRIKASVCRIKGEIELAIDYYNIALKLSELLNDKKAISKNYGGLGNIYCNKGIYNKAIYYYYKTLLISEEQNNEEEIAKSLIGIGVIFYYQQNYEKAISFFLKSLKISKKINKKDLISKCCSNLAVIYLEKKDYSKALKFQFYSLSIGKTIENKDITSKCYSNIGLIYFSQNDYNKALEYYNKSLKEIQDKDGVASVLNNIAFIYNNKKQYEKAVEYSINALNIAKETKSLLIQRNCYDLLSQAYENMQSYRKANEYNKLFKLINDSIYNTENLKEISGLQNKYEMKKKEQELIIQKQENELLKNYNKTTILYRNIFIAISLLIFITSFFIFFWIRYRAIVNKKISKTEKELIQARLKESENETIFLNMQLQNKKMELEYKNKELVNFALHIVEKNDLMEGLKTLLLNVRKNDDINSIIQSIEQNMLILKKGKKEFEVEIEQISETFFLKLKEKYPDITKNEERLASLLRLNLSSKEIATILNIASNTVDFYRHRLRKKLFIDENVGLYEFFKKI